MWSLEARTRAQGKVQAKPVLTGAPGWGRGTCFGYGFWREVSNLAERKKHKETPAGTVRKYNQLVLHGLNDLMCISHGDVSVGFTVQDGRSSLKEDSAVGRGSPIPRKSCKTLYWLK